MGTPLQSHKGPGESSTIYNGRGLRIGLVHARWNEAIVRQLISGCEDELLAQHVLGENIIKEDVPGSWELPFAIRRLVREQQLRGKELDAVVAIGILIKGETMHFEYIADAVSHALMRVQLDQNVPVVFGVLTVLDEGQAWKRAGVVEGGNGHNHGMDWGRAAVELGVKGRRSIVLEHRP